MAVTTSSMLSQTLYYWGEGGQYGPFDVQNDGEWAGWPNFGQVMRYFRKLVKPRLSAKAFGVLYGKAINADGSAIGERWILEMELDNKVPVDMNKRKTIARLLQIPPMLFGLAVLEDMTLEPHPQGQQLATGQTRLVRAAVDTTKYQSNVLTFWQLHQTGNAQSALGLIENDIRDLENFEQQTKGDLRYHVQEILFGYHLLATHIVRDQRRFRPSYDHANEAVRVAKAMQDRDLIATALFTRGWTRLEWGLYGTMQQGIFQVQQDKLGTAIHDFEEAKKVFPTRDGKDAMHPQLLGNLSMKLYHAQAALAASKGERKGERLPPSVLVAIDDVVETVDKQNIDDLYTRVLVRGQLKSWHRGGYLSIRANTFNTAGLPGQALQEMNELERLTRKTFGKEDTRQFAWLDILKANIYMELGEFGTAVDCAIRALISCQDIISITNIAIITDIYGRLLQSSHKASRDVLELGEILRKSPIRLIE